MSILYYLLRLCVVMLFAVFGVSTVIAVPMAMAASEITYHQTETIHIAQSDDVGFAARAPSIVAAKVLSR